MAGTGNVSAMTAMPGVTPSSPSPARARTVVLAANARTPIARPDH